MNNIRHKDDIVVNYNKVVGILDKKIFDSTLQEVKREFVDVSNIDEEISLEMKKLGFYPEMILQESEIDGDESVKLDKIEKYLECLIQIRNENVSQQIISTSIDELDDDIQRHYEELQNESILKSNGLNKTIRELNELKQLNKDKIEEIRDLIRIFKQNQATNDALNDDEEQELTDEDLKKMQFKYKKIVEKNLMLSHFVTDLITSMNCNIANEEELKDILLECSDIKDYDLINN